MEVVVAGRLNPCGFLHLAYASVKQESKAESRNPSDVNSWTSLHDRGKVARVSVMPVETSLRCRSLGSRFRGWSKGQTVSCLRNTYSQPRDLFASGEGNLRLEGRNCRKFWQPMKCSNGLATKESDSHVCSNPIDCFFESSFGASRNFRSQLDKHTVFRVENVRSSNITIRNRSNGSLYCLRTSCGRGGYVSFQNGEFLDRAGLSSSSPGLSPFHPLRQKRQSAFVCHVENGATGNPSELPAQNEESLGDGARSGSSRLERFRSYLKQVDWMNLFFRWEKDEPLWNVPWTGQTIFQVMVLWFAAFWVMGAWLIPIAAQLAGFSRHSLSFRGQALYSLITDIAEGTIGIWILRRCLARFLPLPEGWFPINLKGKWLLEACWGCLLFPLVNKLSQLNLVLLPLPTPLTKSYVEQSMMSRDPIATLLYAVVISVCAPVWEEVIFRGFLLPSMTRYLPLWGAISVSALAFALAHFSLQRILPLTFLGLVMGFVFVRSRNLLASIVLHSLWNGFAFLELL